MWDPGLAEDIKHHRQEKLGEASRDDRPPMANTGDISRAVDERSNGT
jgi:hypothetical protein